MEIDGHLAVLRAEGERLAEVASTTPFAAAVPSCPGWAVEELLRHLGDVHRWAAMVVRERRQERLAADFVGPDGHDELLLWFRAGHEELLDTLAGTPTDARFWVWGPAPSPVAFWARRQAHETAIHRLDVEQAAGLVSGFDDPAAASDGVDEWLTLAARSYRKPVPDGNGRSLHLVATDLDGQWLVRLTDGGVQLDEPTDAADCTVRAPAGSLFALVMNRRDSTGLAISGDRDVLRAWRHSVTF